jgi:hypothetical protein
MRKRFPVYVVGVAALTAILIPSIEPLVLAVCMLASLFAIGALEFILMVRRRARSS